MKQLLVNMLSDIISRMQCSDWISLIAAIAIVSGVGVSLFFGVKSLRQTKDLHRRNFRDSLLNEIIKWAMDIAQSTVEVFLPNMTTLAGMNKGGIFLLTFSGLLIKLDAINAKSEYIQEVAKENNFGEDLNGAIKDTVCSLDLLIKNLRKEIKTGDITEIPESLKEQYKSNGNLRENIRRVVKEAAKLKS